MYVKRRHDFELKDPINSRHERNVRDRTEVNYEFARSNLGIYARNDQSECESGSKPIRADPPERSP